MMHLPTFHINDVFSRTLRKAIALCRVYEYENRDYNDSANGKIPDYNQIGEC